MAHRTMCVALALIICFSSGCGTFASSCGKDGLDVYSGVGGDVKAILSVPEETRKRLAGEKVDDLGLDILLTLLCVVDIPFSAVVDTLLLPYTITLRDRR